MPDFQLNGTQTGHTASEVAGSATATDNANASYRTTIFLQEACFNHRYIRNKDTSNIVERPERLRAVNVGIAAAMARLEENSGVTTVYQTSAEISAGPVKSDKEDPDDLANALGKLNITTSLPPTRTPVDIVKSNATIDILNHRAVKFVHGDIDGDVYLQNLVKWTKDSRNKIVAGESEIPANLAQGDLYLCPESVDAIQSALGTVCEAVDTVIRSTKSMSASQAASRAFVAVRPPGHHCGEDTPSGFCFVNNVVVGAAHAHLNHGIKRVVILDIDLHHGNGTQALAWQINEETCRKSIEQANGAPPESPGLQLFYGSIHDVLSYPCEDGNPALVQAASVSIHGLHGQHVENIHLRPYTSEEQFWAELYAGPYAKLLRKAREFLTETGGPGDDVLVFISCGFDASEHEYPSMSRHQRKVPTAFYHRFARDVCSFAGIYARGRVISVLEGGYSDKALTSGAMAHITGLVNAGQVPSDEEWWNKDNLLALEKISKRRRGGRISQGAPPDTWLARTLEIFTSIDASPIKSTSSRNIVPSSSRTLRDRKSAVDTSQEPTPRGSPSRTVSRKITETLMPSAVKENAQEAVAVSSSSEGDLTGSTTDSSSVSSEEVEILPKKLPRVILRLGPRPDEVIHP